MLSLRGQASGCVSPEILGSFVASQEASRRRRGPVASCRQLSLDLSLPQHLSCANRGPCQFWKLRKDVCFRGGCGRQIALQTFGPAKVRYGSAAVVETVYSRMAGLARQAGARPGQMSALTNTGHQEALQGHDVNVRFSPTAFSQLPMTLDNPRQMT